MAIEDEEETEVVVSAAAAEASFNRDSQVRNPFTWFSRSFDNSCETILVIAPPEKSTL